MHQPAWEPCLWVCGLVDLLRRSGKAPLVCTPSPGLIRDRLMAVLRDRAEEMRSEGVATLTIDAALYDYGFRPGLLFGDVDTILPATDKIGLDSILKRLLAAVVKEGRRLIAEGVAQRASDIDIAAIHGLEWPIYTGGPMFWAETAGDDDEQMLPESGPH